MHGTRIPGSYYSGLCSHQWCGHRVVCNCDNQVVVACLRTRTSKHKGLMHLLRCLVFVEAHFNCHIYPAYINTRLNHLADDLSRNNLPYSYQRCQKPAGSHLRYQASSWISYWTLRLTGPVQPGTIGSVLFSTGTSPIHTENIWSCSQTLSLLLHQVFGWYPFLSV